MKKKENEIINQKNNLEYYEKELKKKDEEKIEQKNNLEYYKNELKKKISLIKMN